MILVIHVHPYPRHSRAVQVLVAAARELPEVEIRSLYDLYPDFDIDVVAEQAALLRADLVVWLHPVYWYSVPALLKHWFDVVLLRGWAYGGQGDGEQTGTALRGKDCMWAVTTGGDSVAYSPVGMHQRSFDEFVAPIEQTARFCGMNWLSPHILYGAHLVSDEAIAASATDFRQRLVDWQSNKSDG